MPKVNQSCKQITDLSARHLRRLRANEVSLQRSLLLSDCGPFTHREGCNSIGIESEAAQSYESSECDDVDLIPNGEQGDIDNIEFLNESDNSSTATDMSTIQSDSSEQVLQHQPGEDENFDNRVNFETLLSHWAISENISHSALCALLKVLRTHHCHMNLPKDPRTLLNTPRSTNIRSVPPGSYWHLGLRTALIQYIEECGNNLSSVNTLYLGISVDGLPLSRSSTHALWPILCSIDPSNSVYLIGAYYGKEKPKEANVFLADFVDEAIDLVENGLTHKRKSFRIRIHKLICDAPAKSFVMNVKNHTGYSSCTKCITEGEYRERRVCFPDIQAAKRTDAHFRNHSDENYHVGYSILEAIPNFDFVTNIPLDYMHLGCLGAMRKLIYSWVSGDLNVRLPYRKCELISLRLETEIKPVVPIEFARKPRSLRYVKQWKATEFRQFLLYTGPVALKFVLSRDIYNHFITLHVAFRILCCKNLSEQYLNYAQELLDHFVLTFKILYGEHHISHNIHGLIHLPADVKKFGPLDSFSAFKYENFMQTLKKLIRKSDQPLQQLSRRYVEIKQNSERKTIAQVRIGLEPQACLPHVYYSALLPTGNNLQYERLKYNGQTFKIGDAANNYCQLIDGAIIKLENLVHDSTRNCLVLVGKEYLEKSDLFTEPCRSSLIDIFVVSKLSETKLWRASKMNNKIFMIPYSDNKFVAMPLLHEQS